MRRLTDIDLRLLRIFCTIVDCNGFQNARTALNMAQSTLSTHMANLEASLGTRLCERGRGGFRMTATGEETYVAAMDLFQSIEGFQAKMKRVHGRETERLRIGVIDTVTTNTQIKLPQAIALFNKDYPNVFIDLEVLGAETIHQSVIDGRRDIAIGPTGPQAKVLSYRSLPGERHQLYCGNKHTWYEMADETISTENFHEARFSVRSYQYFDDVYRLGSIGASAIVSNMEAQEILILSGDYVGFLPTHRAEYWCDKGDMRSVKPKEWNMISPFCAVYDDATGRLQLKNAFLNKLIQVQTETD